MYLCSQGTQCLCSKPTRALCISVVKGLNVCVVNRLRHCMSLESSDSVSVCLCSQLTQALCTSVVKGLSHRISLLGIATVIVDLSLRSKSTQTVCFLLRYFFSRALSLHSNKVCVVGDSSQGNKPAGLIN